VSECHCFLEKRTYKEQEAENGDGDAKGRGDDGYGDGYAGCHEREADERADDAAGEFEDESEQTPDGVEGPEDPGNMLLFFAV
jgi:hypothetical protein